MSVEPSDVLEGKTTFEKLYEAIKQVQSKAVFETITSTLIQHFRVGYYRNKELNSSGQ